MVILLPPWELAKFGALQLSWFGLDHRLFMTESKHFERFNHDPDADGYDADVKNEADPIRHGYEDVLNWVTERAAIKPTDLVVDLGIGTGNLSARLPQAAGLIGVDVSERMLSIAREKLIGVDLLQEDLLAWSDGDEKIDVVVSTYAVHHLESDEKEGLFKNLAARLNPQGRLVFGDLGFADAAHRSECERSWKELGNTAMLEAISDEYFWDVDRARTVLEGLGLRVEIERLGALSWGVAAIR
ncbi:MAG: putative AdoMet-dependent methyltransferase [Planctomycetota bacterium]